MTYSRMKKSTQALWEVFWCSRQGPPSWGAPSQCAQPGIILALGVATQPGWHGWGHMAWLAMNFTCLAAFNQPCCRQKGKGSRHGPHGASRDHMASGERHGEPFPNIEARQDQLFKPRASELKFFIKPWWIFKKTSCFPVIHKVHAGMQSSPAARETVLMCECADAKKSLSTEKLEQKEKKIFISEIRRTLASRVDQFVLKRVHPMNWNDQCKQLWEYCFACGRNSHCGRSGGTATPKNLGPCWRGLQEPSPVGKITWCNGRGSSP